MSKNQPANTPMTRPNFTYAILSVAFVLFLLGFFAFSLSTGNELIRLSKESVELIVELRGDAEDRDRMSVENKIVAGTYTKENSVRFVSKEEAAESVRQEFGEEFLSLDMPNPLYDVFTFNVKADFMTGDQLPAIREELKTHPAVNDVYYQERMVDNIAANMDRIGWLTIVMALLFVSIAVFLIHNTIRLALYANRFVIKNMELVGASWEFIVRPYLYRSLAYGIIAAVVASALLYGLIQVLARDVPELTTVLPFSTHLWVYTLLVIAGVLITVSSTYWVVNKYLRMRVDDLY